MTRWMSTKPLLSTSAAQPILADMHSRVFRENASTIIQIQHYTHVQNLFHSREFLRLHPPENDVDTPCVNIR